MAEIKVKLSNTDILILNALSEDEGSSTSWLASELDISESALSKQVTKLRGLGLVARHRDEDGALLIYITQKGIKARELSESNPKEVKSMAKFSFTIDDDYADDIREIAESEDQSIPDFLSDLVSDALDEFYPEEETEEPEELEETR